jgi:hypothetical protein
MEGMNCRWRRDMPKKFNGRVRFLTIVESPEHKHSHHPQNKHFWLLIKNSFVSRGIPPYSVILSWFFQ